MEKYIITLSRQFASMGRTIAQAMSQELGIEFYDRDIVEKTAKRLGESVPEVSLIDEASVFSYSKRRYPLGMGLVSMQEEVYAVQSNIIRDLADRESCIIVGRCADYLLRDHPNVLNVYVYAPEKARLRNCVEELGMDEKTARRMIHEVDRARELYRMRHCDGIKSVLDHRDILIDSSRFGPERTAKLLCNIVHTCFDVK